ncbi:MAG TPA: hypothetical protein VGS22_16525 [Thermoanaerobaculia bacterium]|jgi:hypothetical protein|nr:hypothetical protein [Thermoanaerobaculia bacterium]
MAALSTNSTRVNLSHAQDLLALPLAAGAVVYAGSLTAVATATGLAVRATDTAGLIVQGVAIEGFDNTGGSAGVVAANGSARFVRVDRAIFRFAYTGTAPKVGQACFVVNDNTVTVEATTNNILAGIIHRLDETGTVFVDQTTLRHQGA